MVLGSLKHPGSPRMSLFVDALLSTFSLGSAFSSLKVLSCLYVTVLSRLWRFRRIPVLNFRVHCFELLHTGPLVPLSAHCRPGGSVRSKRFTCNLCGSTITRLCLNFDAILLGREGQEDLNFESVKGISGDSYHGPERTAPLLTTLPTKAHALLRLKAGRRLLSLQTLQLF